MGNQRDSQKMMPETARMPAHRRFAAPALAAVTIGALAVLSACGGGGSDNAATPATPTPSASMVQGTAATGAFMANAQITIYDADGKSVTVPADANGKFTADVTNLRAPLAVVATGNAGASHATYVSVLASKPAGGASSTVNVTPLTTVIAALLVGGGDPLELAKPNVLSSKAASAQVQQAVALLRAVLANVAAEAGLDAASFDPISTPLVRQGEGADSVLDNVRVTLTSNGAKLTTVGTAVSDDSKGAEVSLTSDALGKPANKVLPKPEIKTTTATFEGIRAALQACFALPPAQRRDATTVLGACQAAFSADYLNRSYTAREDFSLLLGSDDMTGAIFTTPAVVFYSTNAQSQATAYLRMSYVRTDGTTDQISRVATNRAAAGAAPNWQLTGNQRVYDAGVTPRLTRITELNPVSAQGIVSRYESAVRIVFNPNRAEGLKAQVVRVTGPGLPAAGAVLSRSRACGTYGTMAVQNSEGRIRYAANDPVVGVRNQPITTTSQAGNAVVMAAQAINASETVNWSQFANTSTYPAVPLSDAEIDALPEFGRYTFEVWNKNTDGSYKTVLSDTPDVTFSSIPGAANTAPTRMAKLQWNEIDPLGFDFLTTGGSKTGSQVDTNVSWKRNPLAEPVNQVSAFGMLKTTSTDLPLRVLAQTNVPRTATMASLAPNNVSSSSGDACATSLFPTFTQPGDQRNMEIRSATANDTIKYVRVVGTVR